MHLYFLLRVIDYYAEHFLECGEDTYDRERGVAQRPQIAKVNKIMSNSSALFNFM